MGDQVELLDAKGVREHLQSDLYVGALKNTKNLHLHPLKLCIGEAKAAASLGALIFEHSPVTKIIHGPKPAVVTAAGRIEADRDAAGRVLTAPLTTKVLADRLIRLGFRKNALW